MRIQFDAPFENAKSLDELTKMLTQFVEQLQDKLHAQPDFLIVTGEDQSIPKSLPSNTIVFKFDATDVVKTGYFDGENLILP